MWTETNVNGVIVSRNINCILFYSILKLMTVTNHFLLFSSFFWHLSYFHKIWVCCLWNVYMVLSIINTGHETLISNMFFLTKKNKISSKTNCASKISKTQLFISGWQSKMFNSGNKRPFLNPSNLSKTLYSHCWNVRLAKSPW